MKREPTPPVRFHRMPFNLSDANLARIDQSAIKIRSARSRAGKLHTFASRSEILNKLIECADFDALVEELSK